MIIIWLCHHNDIGRLGFMSTIQLLHGTDHIIEIPDINIGNPHNDYGRGFYCTSVDEMAKEWTCKKNTDGFVNVYDFDEDGLKVLNLLSGNHTVLNWIALLLQFRIIEENKAKATECIADVLLRKKAWCIIVWVQF